MSPAFIKRRRGAPPAYFLLEAQGLRWLAQAPGGAPVPKVRSVGADSLSIDRLEPAVPSGADAQRFGAELAATHASGASGFGSPPPSSHPAASGFIADLPLPYGSWASFGPFYAQARVQPYLKMLDPDLPPGTDSVFDVLIARLHDDDPALIGSPEPPARLHGDLWSGNVVWSPDHGGDVRGWLIDPAAHGGHRETDLAMLALFGAPHLPEIIAGYQSVSPLAPGWAQRVSLHQVHPLLVHAVLFGGGYLARATAAAKAAILHSQ